jgi:hypothetical protein
MTKTLYVSDILEPKNKGRVFCGKCKWKNWEPGGFVGMFVCIACGHPSNFKEDHNYARVKINYMREASDINKDNNCPHFCPSWKFWRTR